MSAYVVAPRGFARGGLAWWWSGAAGGMACGRIWRSKGRVAVWLARRVGMAWRGRVGGGAMMGLVHGGAMMVKVAAEPGSQCGVTKGLQCCAAAGKLRRSEDGDVAPCPATQQFSSGKRKK
ncbi:hypothetical protein EDB85DRAFT_1893923 [Lactarius pseudohatsudake]|nr:hypothetical protein EDB85DRAFT_1893923 [Lactarius pseudohatsudake]